MHATYKTGNKCPAPGVWDFDSYTDGSRSPTPTWEELSIPMRIGCTFPPIKSACKGVFWKRRN